MNDGNWVKTASVVPLVLSAAFVAVFFARADAEDAEIRITKPARLTVSLEAVPPAAEAPAVIQLSGSIEGGTPPFTYTLKFGDGQTAEGTTDTGEVVIDHKYTAEGTYRASLLVKDADGRTGTSAAARSTSRLTRRRTDDASVGDVILVPVGRKTARRGRGTSRRRSKPILTSSDLTAPEVSEAAGKEAEAVEESVAEAEEAAEEDVEAAEESVAEAEEAAEEDVEPAEEPEEWAVALEEVLLGKKKPERRRGWRSRRCREGDSEIVDVEPAEEEPEVTVAEKKPRRRDWKFWRRRRKTPGKTEKAEPVTEPVTEAVTEADRGRAAAEAAAAALAVEEREAKRREAFAQLLEERIVVLIGLREAEGMGRVAVSRVPEGEERFGSGARFRKLAPAVKSGLWPKTWELDFEYEPPRRLIVKSDWKGDAGEPYWYIIYRVTNSSEKPIKLNMDVELRTKKGVYSEVYSPRTLKAIRAKEKRKLADFMDMPENLAPAASSEAVAVFSDVSEATVDYDFVVSGLNNTYRVKGEEFQMFRRVLVISYERPGDEFQVEYDRMKYKDAVWVEEEFSRK